MDDRSSPGPVWSGSVAATWLCGERTLMSQACWPTMLASQGQSQTNNRHGLISAMREKSAVRRVFARTLPGEMLVCVMRRIIARRNSSATLHSPFGVAAALLSETGCLLTPILAPWHPRWVGGGWGDPGTLAHPRMGGGTVAHPPQDATLETGPCSHGNLLVPRTRPPEELSYIQCETEQTNKSSVAA